MPGRLRDIDYISLLNNVGFFRAVFRDIVDMQAARIGATKLFWDEDALAAAFSDWQNDSAEWLMRFRDEMDAISIDSDGNGAANLSHIKSMGILLDCLTQHGHQPIKAALIEGILPARMSMMVEGFPNEMFCFLGCFNIFNFQQAERPSDHRYTMDDPPMHFRYLRSMVAYLRQWHPDYGGLERDKTDFYMIFKTMDLFGLEEDYGERLET